MNRLIGFLHLITALAVFALVIAFASIIIPIALACLAGFCLFLWLCAYWIDGISILSRKIKRWFSSRS